MSSDDNGRTMLRWDIFQSKYFLSIFAMLLFLHFAAIAAVGGDAENVTLDLGDWSQARIEQVIEQSRAELVGQRIALISAQFLGTPYQAATLIGSADETEQLVIRLDGVDCFTFLDYVEALRRSEAFVDFSQQLQQVRYHAGQIRYLNRHHFFSDWAHSNPPLLRDVTREIGADLAMSVDKRLNQKADGGSYLKGYPQVARSLHYLPADKVDATLLEKLRTGDYIGFYTPLAGLDVTHVGIVIKQDDATYLRHASSASSFRKVVDSELVAYLKGKTGVIVLRPQ